MWYCGTECQKQNWDIHKVTLGIVIIRVSEPAPFIFYPESATASAPGIRENNFGIF